MGEWVIVQGATGSLCVVPKEISDSYLTHGRYIHIDIMADGIIPAIKKLHEYEMDTRAGVHGYEARLAWNTRAAVKEETE